MSRPSHRTQDLDDDWRPLVATAGGRWRSLAALALALAVAVRCLLLLSAAAGGRWMVVAIAVTGGDRSLSWRPLAMVSVVSVVSHG